MTGAMRAPTASEALQLAQQVQTAERHLKEARELHVSELLQARQKVHYDWKKFYELALKEKDKEMEKEKEKDEKEMDEEMEKDLKEMEKEMEKALKEKEKEKALKEMEKALKEKEQVLIYMKEMEKALKKKETDSDRDRKRCRLINPRVIPRVFPPAVSNYSN